MEKRKHAVFYREIKAAWQDGKVRVGLPAHHHGTKVTIEAPGVLGFKARFLSSSEKALLAEAAHEKASREAASLEKQLSDLRQILQAFRIDEAAALKLIQNNSALWLDRAGLYAAALVDAYRPAHPASHPSSNSPLMKKWVDELPLAANGDADAPLAHQRHVSEKWLAELIKPL